MSTAGSSRSAIDGVGDLAQVVRRDVRRGAGGDCERAVDEQVGKRAGSTAGAVAPSCRAASEQPRPRRAADRRRARRCASRCSRRSRRRRRRSSRGCRCASTSGWRSSQSRPSARARRRSPAARRPRGPCAARRRRPLRSSRSRAVRPRGREARAARAGPPGQPVTNVRSNPVGHARTLSSNVVDGGPAGPAALPPRVDADRRSNRFIHKWAFGPKRLQEVESRAQYSPARAISGPPGPPYGWRRSHARHAGGRIILEGSNESSHSWGTQAWAPGPCRDRGRRRAAWRPAAARRTRRARSGGASSASGDTIPVGILHSLSGTMAISEVSVRDAELLAIEEINKAGGVLGKQLKPVVEDGALGLADVRREGAEAHLDRQGRRDVRRLDLGEPQGDAARLRAQQGAAVLPRPVRGPGGVAVHLLHRRHDQPADHPRPRVPQGGAEGQDALPRRARTTSSRARPTRRSRPGRRPTA